MTAYQRYLKKKAGSITFRWVTNAFYKQDKTRYPAEWRYAWQNIECSHIQDINSMRSCTYYHTSVGFLSLPVSFRNWILCNFSEADRKTPSCLKEPHFLLNTQIGSELVPMQHGSSKSFFGIDMESWEKPFSFWDLHEWRWWWSFVEYLTTPNIKLSLNAKKQVI